MLLDTFIYAALLPFSVAAVVALTVRRIRLAPGVAWAAGIALAFIAGDVALSGFRSLVEPREAVHWLPHAVLLAAGIAALSNNAYRVVRQFALVLSVALVIGLPLRLLAGSAYVTLRWTVFEKLAHLSLLSATFALSWLLLGTAGDDEHPRLRPLLLIAVSTGAAVVIALSGVFVYGELCGVVAAAVTGTLASAVADDTRYPRIRVPFFPLRATPSPWRLSGAAGAVTCSLGGLVVLCVFYGELTPVNATLLLLSLALGAGRLPRFATSLGGWQSAAIRVVVCLLTLGIALIRAIAAAQVSMEAGPYAMN
jgi:hypothetical protein